MHLLVSSPLDIPTLRSVLGLVPDDLGASVVGHGGHSVTELVASLTPQVTQLDLVTLDPGIDRPVTLRNGKIRAFVGPYRSRARTRALDLFAAERRFVAETVSRQRPDVVSAHWTYEYALGALDAAAPTLITIRDWAPAILRYQPDRYRTVRLAMQMLCFRRGEHFAAVSPYMAKKAERATRTTVTVLPNVLGGSWFQAPSASLDGTRVIAANNGFGRRKNVMALLRAWPEVLLAVPQAELILTGDGYGQGGPAAQWAASRGLAQGVTFAGPLPRPELQRLISSGRVFVHPSREESFGMVVLEAMSLGLPVVGGASSGAVPWLLRDEAGITVDVKDPRAIAGAIMSLLRDRSLADKIGARARNDALQRFSATAVSELYLRRLEELL